MTTILRLTPVFHALVVALLLGLYFPAPATAAEDKAVYAVQVDGLACPFCAYGIEKQLTRIDGVASVETDIKSGSVVITMKPGATLDEAEAKRAVEAAGFTLREFRKKDTAG
jgi:mercuric ion binding protein